MDSGTTFSFFPKDVWESVNNHIDVFCESAKDIRRPDGHKKYCHGDRYEKKILGSMTTCFKYDKNYFESNEGPGLRHFFLGYPIIRIMVEDENGNAVNWDWFPSEYLYYERNVNDYCIAALPQSKKQILFGSTLLRQNQVVVQVDED